MSAPSITVSQTDFCDAVSHVNITSEPTSGYDTPIPRARRMYEHKVSVQKDGQITTVSRHFKSNGHSHKDMKFSVLEWCTPKFDPSNTARRRRLELSWIFKLHCLAPIGINQFV